MVCCSLCELRKNHNDIMFDQQEIILWRKGEVAHRHSAKGIEDSTQRFEG